MTLPASGTIAMSDVNTELGYSSSAVITLDDSAVRTLFQKTGAGTTISLSDGYGKSSGYTTTITPSSYAVNEGDTLTVTVTTSPAVTTTLYYWYTMTSSTDSNIYGDLVAPVQGSVSIVNGIGSFSSTISADRLSVEGTETFKYNVYSDSGYTNLIAQSANVSIADTSTFGTTETISATTITEGQYIDFTFAGVQSYVGSGGAVFLVKVITTAAVTATDSIADGSIVANADNYDNTTANIDTCSLTVSGSTASGTFRLGTFAQQNSTSTGTYSFRLAFYNNSGTSLRYLSPIITVNTGTPNAILQQRINTFSSATANTLTISATTFQTGDLGLYLEYVPTTVSSNALATGFTSLASQQPSYLLRVSGKILVAGDIGSTITGGTSTGTPRKIFIGTRPVGVKFRELAAISSGSNNVTGAWTLSSSFTGLTEVPLDEIWYLVYHGYASGASNWATTTEQPALTTIYTNSGAQFQRAQIGAIYPGTPIRGTNNSLETYWTATMSGTIGRQIAIFKVVYDKITTDFTSAKTNLSATSWSTSDALSGCWTGTYFILGNTTGGIASSTDAATWTFSSALNTAGWASSPVSSMASNGTGKVLVTAGATKYAYSSDHGATWTIVSTTNSTIPYGVYKVAYINGYFWAFGNNYGALSRSTDGVTWTHLGNLSGQFAIVHAVTWDGEYYTAYSSGTGALSFYSSTGNFGSWSSGSITAMAPQSLGATSVYYDSTTDSIYYASSYDNSIVVRSGNILGTSIGTTNVGGQNVTGIIRTNTYGIVQTVSLNNYIHVYKPDTRQWYKSRSLTVVTGWTATFPAGLIYNGSKLVVFGTGANVAWISV